MNSTGDLPAPETDGMTLLDAHGQHTQKIEDRSQRAAVGTPDYLAPEILLGAEHGLHFTQNPHLGIILGVSEELK